MAKGKSIKWTPQQLDAMGALNASEQELARAVTVPALAELLDAPATDLHNPAQAEGNEQP